MGQGRGGVSIGEALAEARRHAGLTTAHCRGTGRGTNSPCCVTVAAWRAPGTGHMERLPSGSYRVHVYAGAEPLTGRRLRYWQTVETGCADAAT